MGTCERMRQVGAYRDGELAPADAATFADHLGLCESCKAELAQLAALSSVLTTAHVPGMPEGLAERLHENVVVVRERSVLKLAESLIAAAAILIVACGGWVWSGSSASEGAAAGEVAWQSAAVTLNVETVSSDAQQLEQWMAEGLALEKTNE